MRRSPVKPSSILKASIIALAGVLYLLPLRQNWIERRYSETFYPTLQRVITPLSNTVPFAVFDLLVIGAVVGLGTWFGVTIKRAGKGRRLKVLPRLLLNTVVLGAAGVLLFLVMWGLNYRRTPLLDRLDYDRSRITPQSAEDLAVIDVRTLNALVKQAHEGPGPARGQWDGRIAPSFQQVIKTLGNEQGIATGKPKISLFNPYLNSTGVEGLTDPFALEVILNSRLLPPETPFALAHEWAHLAGFADESEANFIALLTCIRSDDPGVRYSGWLELYEALPVRLSDRRHDTGAKPGNGDEDGASRRNQEVKKQREAQGKDSQDGENQGEHQNGDELKLDPQVLADITAIQDRLRTSISPWLSAAETKVYDRYLKANRVEAGIASYGLFVRLVLGTRFTGNWSPALKAR